jgi:arylsulfatase A
MGLECIHRIDCTRQLRGDTLLRRTFNCFPVCWLFCVCTIHINTSFSQDDRPPNFVLIVCDNLGMGDVGCFGSVKHATPRLDKMASEGLKLTSFYVASGVCSPSRAAIMSGCYPRRVGMHWTEPDGLVLRPVSPNGLSPIETTIAEVFQSKGYTTICIGKWHLGDQPDFLPTKQGFDQFFGIPYSDDMTAREGQNWPPIPLMEDETVIDAPVDRDYLTQRYTERAVSFIQQNAKRPFFLYMPQAMPGSTAAPFASESFKGKSQNGNYGDSIEELDWSTGQVLDSLRREGIAEHTLVIWTSDNGAQWRSPRQGSNQPWGGWGGWRYSTAEGAMRVPAIVWWPGKIQAGTSSDEIFSTIDLLPSFAELIGAKLPDKPIDGKSIAKLFQGNVRTLSPHDAIYYYSGKDLYAVRSGKWKLYVKSPRHIEEPKREEKVPYLVDLSQDPSESNNVAEQNPAVVAQLDGLVNRARAELGDGDRNGTGQRLVGRVEVPAPQVLKK